MSVFKIFMRSLGLIPFALGITFLFTPHAEGLTYLVTNTNDTTSTASLRGAIMSANRIGGNNIIVLGQASGKSRNVPPRQWIFRLTLSGADEDSARTGDLDITHGNVITPGGIRLGDSTRDNLTIIGATPNVVIDATGLGDRVFQVLPGARLTLENLVIDGGAAPGEGWSIADGEAGGAIYNAGTLLLEHCIITNNLSGGGNFPEGNAGGTSGGDGGALYNSGTLTMNNCIVAGNSSGAGTDGAYGGNGGGIKNDGVCFLTACVISENQSGNGGGPEGNSPGFGGGGGSGGGIFNSGTIVLNNCIVSANASGQGSSGGDPSGLITVFAPGGPGGPAGNGAGIYNDGQMQLNFSTVNSNSCGNGGNGGSFGTGGNAGAGGNGAGIFNAGKLSLNTSTISGNFCGNGGAGGSGFFDGANGGAGGGGGGIYNVGSMDLTSCTIILNQTGVGGSGGNAFGFNNSSPASGGQGGNGGGVFNAGDVAIAVRNTLIALDLINAGGAGGTNTGTSIFPPTPISPTAETIELIGNSGADGIGFDVAGVFTSQGFNLISAADGSTGFTNGVNADHIGSIASPIDPLLGPLQMNGGFTPTHALLPGSPAIDQGSSFGIRTDQRGDKRPFNNPLTPNAPGGDGSDIGAFELQ